MERRHALKTILMSMGGIALLRPGKAVATPNTNAAAPNADSAPAGTCWITPSLTEGPYYFNPNLIRQDIRETKTGVLLDLQITVIDELCNPRAGALVDIWHCDKDGCYSGYNQPTCNAVGQTFLRGTQITDLNGLVQFRTIYPGWYPGRATHIHFKVRTSTTTYKTSQFAFPDSVNDTVHTSALYTRGINPTTNVEDGIFGSATPQYLMVDVVGDTTNGYLGTYSIGLQAISTDVEVVTTPNALRLTAAPSPFRTNTVLQGTLPSAGEVRVAIYDLSGRRIREVTSGWRPGGTFEAGWDGRDEAGLELPAGVYMAFLEHERAYVFARLVRVR